MKTPVNFDPVKKIWSVPLELKEFSDGYSIGQVILESLSRIDPEKVMELDCETERKITANELKELTIKCAVNLTRIGVKKGDVVLIVSNYNHYLAASFFGCFTVGAIVHPLDISSNEDELEYAIQITDPKLILCETNTITLMEKVLKKFSSLNAKILLFDSEKPEHSVKEILFRDVENLNSFEATNLGDSNETIAVLMCSSGTSGIPKVTALSHSSVIHRSYGWWDITENSIIYCSSIIRWISQLSALIFTTIVGCTRVTVSRPPTPDKSLEIIEKYKVTHLFIGVVPANELLLNLESRNKTLDTVERILVGGEILQESFMELGNKILIKGNMIAAYGMTEAGGVIASTEWLEGYKGSAVGLLDDVAVKLIDDKMNKVGPNEKGQICIKSKYMFKKYWKGARKTSEAFDQDGWYLSGDFGYFDQNHLLHVVDRYREIITYNGKMILPSEIEVIINSHPKVKSGVVVGITHETKGQLPVAFIILKNSTPGVEVLKELKNDVYKFLELRVPNEHLPRGGIYFVNEFPITKTGKILRPRLKEIADDYRQKQNAC